jgi:chemotaxis protein MotB
MAVVVACGGISKERYGAKEAEAAKYKQEAAALESKAKSLEEENATLQKQVSATKSELGTTTAKLTEQRAEYDRIKPRTINTGERLLFKENSSKLTTEGRHALDAMADAIKPQLKDKTILVVGYTDNSEAGGKNAKARRWQLSTARALEVAKYLVGRGIDPALIGVAGFGEVRPVAANDSLANRTLNRRVEIALTPSRFEVEPVEVSPATLEPK